MIYLVFWPQSESLSAISRNSIGALLVAEEPENAALSRWI